MSTKFSVIVPTYNRAHTIVAAIASVLQQSYENFEIIVVDDGSTDNTKEALKSVTDKRLSYYNKRNEERGAARNYGAKLAGGDYICFLDSDDVLYNNHLLVAAAFIAEKNNPEAFHLGYNVIDTNGKILWRADKLPSPVNPILIKGNSLSCNGVFLRKDIALANPFNEDRALSAAEDWELWLRIASQYPIYAINEITSAIINHESRSVLEEDYNKLIKRMDTFLKYVLADEKITGYYKNKLGLVKSSCYTYIALHLALSGKNKAKSVKYLFKGIGENPAVVFSRRFMAILKHLLR